MEIKIKNQEIRQLMEIQSPTFPRYVTQLLNLANQNAQATRPKEVGQMSELFKKWSGKTIEEWETWYLEHYPDAIEEATRKILEMMSLLRETCDLIDESMIRDWVRDLVIVKTFIGMRFQEAIVKTIAERFQKSYRLASPEEESRGIDGYIDDIPLSLKPASYMGKQSLKEKIEGYVVYYEKQKDGLRIVIPEVLEKLFSRG